MKKNMSDTDRSFRMVSAVIFSLLNIGAVIQLPESILVWAAVLVLTVTAITGNCPMYKLFGINTRDKRKYESRD